MRTNLHAGWLSLENNFDGGNGLTDHLSAAAEEI
jgi:hypothetical protein